MRGLILGLTATAVFASPVLAADSAAVDAATRAWIDLMDPAAKARSDAYYESGYALDLVDTLIQVAIAALLLMTGWSLGLRERIQTRLKRPFAITAAFAGIFLVAVTALNLPFAFYRYFMREHAYGMSNQSFIGWFVEHMVNEAISWVMGAIVIAVIYMLIRKLGRVWWIAAAATVTAFMVVILVISPVFIAPLTNTYTPMPEGQQKQEILGLAVASGVPANDVFVYDESRQSKRVTANVSGIFDTMRISLADNTLTRLSPAAVRMVMAHEIGHYVLGLAGFLTMLAVYFVLVFWAVDRLFHVFAGSERWGVRDLGDPAGMPLAIALVFTVFYVSGPIYSGALRHYEHQADIFGLNASREPDGFAEAALMLSEFRKMEPGPVERILFYDHPSGYDRIHMAMQWKAAEMAMGRIPEGPLGPPADFRLAPTEGPGT